MVQILLFEENYGIWDIVIDSEILRKAIIRNNIAEEKKKCGVMCYNCDSIMVNKNNYCVCLFCNTTLKY